MLNNPEFRKNLWLEFSAHRVVTGLVILSLIFLAASVGEGDLFGWSFGIGIALCAVWGTKLAADSVGEEIKQKTWDFIKISSINPLKLMLGKVFGATSYAWFLTIVCIIVGYINFPTDNKTWPADYGYYSVHKNEFFLYCILLGLTCHFMGYLGAIKSINPQKHTQRMGGGLITVIILFFAGSEFSEVADLGRYHAPAPEGYNYYNLSEHLWYGIQTKTIGFAIFNLYLQLFWVAIGCYNLTKSQLGYKVSNLSWVLFILFSVFYSIGYTYDSSAVQLTLDITEKVGTIESYGLVGMAISALYYYAVMMLEKKDIVTVKKIISIYKEKDFTGLNYEIPSWVATLNIFIIFTIISLLTNSAIAEHISSIFLLVLRDTAIILFFNISTSKRKEITAIIYIIILYSLAPFLAKNLLSDFAAYWAVTIFIPSQATNWISVLIILAEAGGCWLMLLNRLKTKV